VSDEQAGVKWLRQQIKSNLGLARLAMGAENINAQWMEVSSGVLHTGPGTEADCWDGTWPMGDSRLTRFIAAHDPQDVIADCEAKLEILRWHYILTSGGDDPENEEFSIYRFPSHPYDFGCVCCHYYAQGAVRNYGYCGTVKALASAYKHRPGYAEHWAM